MQDKLEVNFSKEIYMQELELMEKQFGQEEELYPLINMLLRTISAVNKYSIRMVANATSTSKISARRLLKGYSGYPDIAILDREFDINEKNEENIGKIYACVEVKDEEELINFGKNEVEFSLRENLYQRVKISLAKKGNRARYQATKIDKEKKINLGGIEYIKGRYYEIENVESISVGNDNEEIEFESIKDEELKKLSVCKIKENHSTNLISVMIEDYSELLFQVEQERQIMTQIMTKDQVQLMGELLWYGRVIYTNGKKWKMFKLNIICENEKKKEWTDFRDDILKAQNWIDVVKNYKYRLETTETADLCNGEWDKLINGLSNFFEDISPI